MPTTREALFWKKKEFVSFLLSILVFFIHSYFAPDTADGSVMAVVNHKVSYFFSCSVTKFAVPMFFMLSGLTFFKGYTPQKYVGKIKSRLFTLVIPYLIWNTVWLLWELFTSYSFAAALSQSEPYPLTLLSIAKGIFFYGCNLPFWFIFDLILFSLAAPLVFLVIKNKYVGGGCILLLSVLSLWGVHLPESVFYYPQAIVFYLIGAVVGYHFFDVAAKPSKKPVRVASAVFLVGYILAKNFVPIQLHVDNYLTQTVVYTLAAVSLWNIIDWFMGNLKPRAIYQRSFAVYAMHLNVGMILLKLFSFFIPQTPQWEIPQFVAMIVATLVIINVFCALLEKFAPKLYGVLMGKRSKSV